MIKPNRPSFDDAIESGSAQHTVAERRSGRRGGTVSKRSRGDVTIYDGPKVMRVVLGSHDRGPELVGAQVRRYPSLNVALQNETRPTICAALARLGQSATISTRKAQSALAVVPRAATEDPKIGGVRSRCK